MLHIVTDGTVDMPEAWRETYQITVVPIHIQFGNETFLQGVDMDDEAFYRRIDESGVIPTTSQPSPHRLVEIYEKIASPGDDIISIHVSEKLSGTMDSARAAAKMLAGKINVVPFDSMSGSAAIGWMCRHARLLARRGAALTTILDELAAARAKHEVLLTLDSLKYARMSGRVSRLQASLASALRVKPIVLLQDGKLNIVDKVRTRSASFRRILEMGKEKIGQQRINLSVVHARAPQAAEQLFAEAKKHFNIAMSNIVDLSISVTVHLGPGTVGYVFYPALDE